MQYATLLYLTALRIARSQIGYCQSVEDPLNFKWLLLGQQREKRRGDPDANDLQTALQVLDQLSAHGNPLHLYQKTTKSVQLEHVLGATDMNWGWFSTSLISPKPVICLAQQWPSKKLYKPIVLSVSQVKGRALAGAFAFQQIFFFAIVLSVVGLLLPVWKICL